MKKKYLFKIFFIIIWFLTLVFASFWGYENPEKVEILKSYLEKNIPPKVNRENNIYEKVIANSFTVEFSKVVSLSEKTAFIVNDKNFSKFNETLIKIYTQNGYVIDGLNPKKLKLPNSFTLQRNGGVKTVFFHNGKGFALISSSKTNCFYASIVSLENGNEIFKTKCLPDANKAVDFNGLGSSYTHLNNKIYLSLGTPEQHSIKIAILAQDKNSMFGKIIEIDTNDLEKLNLNQTNNLKLKIFTMGHRTPQGLTKVNNFIFNVEHGPKGGDELNRLIKDKNYGWPLVSYGTEYLYSNEGKSFKVNHENNNFEEPLFAFVPSIGISSLNVCPNKLKNYYKKPCLIALSLHGNSLMPGRSLIIFLLNESMNSVNSIEKIYLGEELRLRHFVTNSKNELYEDESGHIYVSADKIGIYKINFVKFR